MNGGGPLAHRSLVWIGDRSYSWYLWHWPILTIGFSLGFEGDIGPVVGLVLLSLLLAIISYRFVELPFWKGRLGNAEASRILLISVLVMAMVVAVSFHWKRSLPPGLGASTQIPAGQLGVPKIYGLSCDAWFSHAKVEPCEFGNPEGSKSVVLLGDSIGLQWFSAFEAVFSEAGWRIIVLTKSACAIVDVEYYYPRINGMYDVCTEWREGVISYLEAEKPDAIIIGSAASYRFDEDQWVAGTRRILDRLASVSDQILLIPGTPSLGFSGPGCVARHTDPSGDIDANACVGRELFDRVDRVTGYLAGATAGFSNVSILELNDLVCPAKICRSIGDDGILIFRDNQHLSDSFVRTLIPQVNARVAGWVLLDH